MAGQGCLGCRPPQRLQLVFEVLFRFSIVSTVAVLLSVIAYVFIWVTHASLARQMSSAFSRVRSDSLSSLLRILSSCTPSTIRSLMRLSVKLPNSHVFAFVRRSVTKWSIGSPACWVLVLKTCLSQVTFFLGLQ